VNLENWKKIVHEKISLPKVEVLIQTKVSRKTKTTFTENRWI